MDTESSIEVIRAFNGETVLEEDLERVNEVERTNEAKRLDVDCIVRVGELCLLGRLGIAGSSIFGIACKAGERIGVDVGDVRLDDLR
jgi:hypothetical protein